MRQRGFTHDRQDGRMVGTLWTFGHSTLAWADFVRVLVCHGIGTVADVRRFPGSRRHPHFESQTMALALSEAGVGYVHLPALGGRRRPLPDSRNLAWRNASFRGYADYMATPGYAEGRVALEALASAAPTTMLCAEALWWQCHRGLVADDFKSGGWDVRHLTARGVEPHPYTSAARIVDGRLDYSGAASPQPGLF